jgi:hypothetical protein
MSCVWLPERPSASGLPTHRRLRGFFVVRPPRERPMAWSQPLFTGASAVLVRLDDGSVDHRVFVVRIIGQGLEKTLPNPTRGPARKASVGILPAPEALRQSRQGAPERNFQITASTNRRLPSSLLRPTVPGRPAAVPQFAKTGRRAIRGASSPSLPKKAPMNHALNDLRIWRVL